MDPLPSANRGDAAKGGGRVEITVPAALRSLSMAGAASKALAAWRRRSTGDGRALVAEIENNLRYLDLVADDGVPLDRVIGDLSTAEFDRLMKEGYSFNALQRRKIQAMPSLDATDLAGWQGKDTEALVRSIYAKLKDIRVKYPHTAASGKYRWNVRVQNVRKRIWLLVKHLDG